ncbi:MAG: M6 family metalloprotease domain-containing protein [Muribaculaceae bacterium]|nr:M6 family metalloprotease domain-containing protein [Muribaculaceae bacterium]
MSAADGPGLPLRGSIPSISPSDEGSPILVILVQYKDIKFTHLNPARYFGDMMNVEGFSELGARACVREYFESQSGGKFRPVFEVQGPVTLSQNRSYYGSNSTSGADKAPEDMYLHGASAIDASVDFSRFDNDGDGKVDNVVIIYAGPSEADSGLTSCVKPHAGSLAEKKKSMTLDGVSLDKYICLNEWDGGHPTGQGPIVRVLCEALGLPGLGHTTEVGASFTPGPWSVMDRGHLAAEGIAPVGMSLFERYALGWAQPRIIDGPTTASLAPLGESGEGYLLPTERKNEFFLLENRQQTGYDTELPGHGLLIWHVDMNRPEGMTSGVNDIASHQYVDIVEACGEANMHSPEIVEAYTWPRPDCAGFAPMSWGGIDTELPITEIQEDENGRVSFLVCGGARDLSTPGKPEVEVSANGEARISWTATESAEGYIVGLSHAATGALSETACTETSLTIAGLKNEESYSARVRAVRDNILSEWSEATTFAIPAAGWAQTAPEAEAEAEFEDYRFEARWKPMAGAVSYLLTIVGDHGRGEEETFIDFGFRNTTCVELPAGWEWSGDEADLYFGNSTGFYGDSAPALKFDSFGSRLTSPGNQGTRVSRLEMWVRGAQGAEESALVVEGLAGEARKQVARITPPTEEGSTIVIDNFPTGTERVSLVYEKIVGNLAIDDLRLTTVHTLPTPLEGYTEKNVGLCESHTVELNHPVAPVYHYYVQGVDANGLVSVRSNAGVVLVPEWAGIDEPAVAPEGGELRLTAGGVAYSGGRRGDIVRAYSTTGLLCGEAAADANGNAELKLPAGLYVVAAPCGSAKVLVK